MQTKSDNLRKSIPLRIGVILIISILLIGSILVLRISDQDNNVIDKTLYHSHLDALIDKLSTYPKHSCNYLQPDVTLPQKQGAPLV